MLTEKLDFKLETYSELTLGMVHRERGQRKANVQECSRGNLLLKKRGEEKRMKEMKNEGKKRKQG